MLGLGLGLGIIEKTDVSRACPLSGRILGQANT